MLKKAHSFSYLFFIGCITVSVYLISTALIEFIFVDWLFVIYEIPQLYNHIYILVLLIGFSFVTWNAFPNLTPTRRFLIAFCIVLCSIGLFYLHKKNHYYVTMKPFIKTVDKQQVIQGDYVVIKGRGFGNAWESGKIQVGTLELRIINWNQREITAEVPVPNTYFTDNMVITTHEGKTSNPVSMEIADPSIILNPTN